jgi:hypothetical protein
MPAKAPEPVAPVAPEPPMPKTAKDHEANQMLVLNRAAAQNEVRPSATPIPEPPAPPEINVAKAAKGIDAQDVMGGDSQLKFAQQQRQQALDVGDAKAVEAWDKEIRKVNQGRLGAAMDAQDASQTGLFGVTEYDSSMPLFDQKLDAEEARLAAEYLERDTAMQQEVARAEREAMGYHDMTFDQKKAEAGIAEGWAPAELPPAPEAPQPLRLYRGAPQGRKGGKTVGDALFMTPDRKVAEMYAGEGGSVTEADITFGNLLEAKTWAEAKKTLGLPKSATMDDLVNKARADGFDGVTFETTNGREYISIPAPEPAVPPARAIEIPAAADKRLSPDRVQSTAEILMKWANANLFQGQWPVKSIDEAIALVRAKNRQLWSENIPGIDLDKANNDLVMGRNSPAVQDVSNAYRQFYGVKMPEQGAAPSRPRAQQQTAQQQSRSISDIHDLKFDMIDAELEENLALARVLRAELYPKDRIPELIEAWRKVVGDDVRIRVLDSYKQATKSEQWGGDGNELGDIAGMYEHWKDTIHIYQLLSPVDAGGRRIRYTFSDLLSNGFHESFHRIVRMAMSDKDIDILNTPMARLKAAMAMDDWGSDRGKIAYDELVTEAAARVFVARHNNLDPVTAIIDEIFRAADPTKTIPQWARDAAAQVAGGLNKVYDFIEKSVNLFQGRGFESISTVFEKAASGQMRATDPSLRLKFDGENFSPVSDAGEIHKWKVDLMEDFAWDGGPVSSIAKSLEIRLSDLAHGSNPFDEPPSVKAAQQFADLTSTLRQVDNGKLKGVSKKALDAAEKGDPEQALAEATDYANRRMAEIDTKIEDIKRRAIEEGC